MSLKHYNALAYVKPVGEDLQHVTHSNGKDYHSDIYLLQHVTELVRTQNMLDQVQARFQEVRSSIPDELQVQLDGLDDYQKMEITDSRFAQSLSERQSQIKAFMQKLDDWQVAHKDDERTSKLKAAYAKLDEAVLRQFGVD